MLHFFFLDNMARTRAYGSAWPIEDHSDFLQCRSFGLWIQEIYDNDLGDEDDDVDKVELPLDRFKPDGVDVPRQDQPDYQLGKGYSY